MLFRGSLYSIFATEFVTGHQLDEAKHAKEMALNGSYANAADAGIGHRASSGGVDGFQHLEPEAYPAVGSGRSGLSTRLFSRFEDRRKQKLAQGLRHGYAHSQPVSQ